MFNQHRAMLLGLIVVQGANLVAMNACHLKTLGPKDGELVTRSNDFKKQAATLTVDSQNKTKNSLSYSNEAIQAALIVTSQNQKQKFLRCSNEAIKEAELLKEAQLTKEEKAAQSRMYFSNCGGNPIIVDAHENNFNNSRSYLDIFPHYSRSLY